ncbi:hypothetical protein CF336_g7596, partial [Tilletia laevis]
MSAADGDAAHSVARALSGNSDDTTQQLLAIVDSSSSSSSSSSEDGLGLGAALARTLHAIIRHHILFPLALTTPALLATVTHIAARLAPPQLQSAPRPPAGIDTQNTEIAPPPASPFHDFLIDAVWTVDAELELLSDAALGIASQTQLPLNKQIERRAEQIRIPHPSSDNQITFHDAQERLAALVKSLVHARHLTRELVAERLELPLLHRLNLFPEPLNTINARVAKVNTSINYKQDKYNLLREENEGYTALIKLLLESIGPALKPVYVLDQSNSHSSSTAPTGANYTSPPIAIIETESAHERTTRATIVLKKIRALVGYFNLDSSRVLDVLLDVMGLHLTQHWPFFCTLLELSAWGEHLRSGRSKADDHHHEMDIDSDAESQSQSQSQSQKGKGKAKQTGTAHTSAQRRPRPLGDLESEINNLPDYLASETGNSTCAQLIGFKFRDYQRPESADVLPPELYLLTALLVHRGFVRLLDLVPHLTPDAAQMRELELEHRKRMRAGNRKVELNNALAMAAPLEDDGAGGGGRRPASSSSGAFSSNPTADTGTNPPASGTNTDAGKKRENQIVGLTRAFLALGSLRHAWFFLGRSPWLLTAHPDLADAYCRLLKVVLAPTYRHVASSQLEPVLRSTPPLSRLAVKPSAIAAGSTDGGKAASTSPQSLPSIGPLPTHALTLTLHAPEPLWTAEKRFVFFYPFWTAELPHCAKPADFFTVFVPMLKFLGPFFYRDLELYSAICRLGKVGLRMCVGKAGVDGQVGDGEGAGAGAELSAVAVEQKERWLDVVRTYLLPAHILTDGLSYVGTELWRMLSCLEYKERYGLYGEWKYRLYLRDDLQGRRADAERDARSVLRRISKDSDKAKAMAMGKKLAKVAHSNPIVFFSVALAQVQAYDNFAFSLVECLRFASLTPLESDVFMFVLLDALSDDKKDRLKSDGLNTSLWLASLATFSGILLRRCEKVDPVPLLQYVVNSLVSQNTNDIVIVRELVKQMSGLVVLETLDDRQVDALFGGRLLRVEAMMAPEHKPDSEGREAMLRSGERLLGSLRRSRMGVPLLVLLAQMRGSCVFAEEMGLVEEGSSGAGGGRKAVAAMFDS